MMWVKYLLLRLQVKSGMVIVRLRKSRKEQWTYLTAREKRLKEAREYVCYTHITYHELSINEAHTYQEPITRERASN